MQHQGCAKQKIFECQRRRKVIFIELRATSSLVETLAGEGLTFRHEDRRVSCDELNHDTTRSLESPGQKREFEQ